MENIHLVNGLVELQILLFISNNIFVSNSNYLWMTVMLTLLVLKQGYSRNSRLTLQRLMPWIITSAINQPAWYWLFRIKDYSGYGLIQWQMTLHGSVFSHWLSPYPKWSLRKNIGTCQPRGRISIIFPSSVSRNGRTFFLFPQNNSAYSYVNIYIFLF